VTGIPKSQIAFPKLVLLKGELLAATIARHGDTTGSGQDEATQIYVNALFVPISVEHAPEISLEIGSSEPTMPSMPSISSVYASALLDYERRLPTLRRSYDGTSRGRNIPP
jgi:hypothetical protein